MVFVRDASHPSQELAVGGAANTCRSSPTTVANTTSLYTNGFEAGARLRIPVAHHDGNYFADEATLDQLEGEGRVAFRYCDNPNGSLRDIAGVLSANGRVLGMMPHPERAIEPAAHPALGGADGRGIFENLVRNLVSA